MITTTFCTGPPSPEPTVGNWSRAQSRVRSQTRLDQRTHTLLRLWRTWARCSNGWQNVLYAGNGRRSSQVAPRSYHLFRWRRVPEVQAAFGQEFVFARPTRPHATCSRTYSGSRSPALRLRFFRIAQQGASPGGRTGSGAPEDDSTDSEDSKNNAHMVEIAMDFGGIQI